MKYFVCIVVMLTLFSGHGQTVNSGQMTIMPGTEMSTGFDLINTPTGTIKNDGIFYVYRNFTNEGVVDFNTGSAGKTIFRSTAIQELGGTQESKFVNILFDNTAAFELSNSFSVFGNVEFSNGVVNNDDFGGTFQFNPNASHANVGDQSFVDGEVLKLGNQAFDFPTGDQGYYRYSAITSPDVNADLYSNQYYLINSNQLYSHTQKASVDISYVDQKEFWRIEREAGNAQVIVTLSWHEATTDPFILDNIGDVHIVRWDFTTNSWHDEGGVVDFVNQTVSTPAVLDKYGVFALGVVKSGFVLPPCFEVFNAVSSDEDGKNDFFRIDCIEQFPNNQVEIYNRWGVKVFETNGYNSTTNVFKGYSDGRATLNREDKLPTGTYFYIITIKDNINPNEESKTIKKSGYLHLESNK